MPNTSANKPALKRTVGLLPLTLIAAGGILGSGWLFSPLLTAQLAGPASIIAWVIGAFAMLLLAFTFAEIASVLPVAGGIARIPRYTHGDITAAVIGWTAWVGYCTQAPIEVAVVLRYAAVSWPALVVDAKSGDLSVFGFTIAALMLIVFVMINAIGAVAFARANSAITWLKFAIPIIIAITFIASRFDTENFSSTAGFAPYGWHGILSAVSTGGIIFALIGFRHAIDMAGETRNPRKNVPLALIFGLLIPLAIYLLLQVSFIGALSKEELSNGWANIESSHGLGPLAAVSMALGISWLTAVIYGGAIIGPAGGALVATGSNARLAYALSRNHFLPAIFARLSLRGIPVYALLLNFLLGFSLLLSLQFDQIVAINSAAIVLSFSIGPVAMIALRRQILNPPDRFNIPAPRLVAVLGFIVSALIVYWSGWTSMQVLLLVIVTALITLFVKRMVFERKSLDTFDTREALWLLPYLGSLTLVSWLGNFGGSGLIPFGWDIVLVILLALLNFRIANWCALDNEKAKVYREAHKPPPGSEFDEPP
ncbi:MAG: APC family permease [Halioglobus sp.]|nr:APC family permease [Halioglobus sp.]